MRYFIRYVFGVFIDAYYYTILVCCSDQNGMLGRVRGNVLIKWSITCGESWIVENLGQLWFLPLLCYLTRTKTT
jgi:hypothetical protein